MGLIFMNNIGLILVGEGNYYCYIEIFGNNGNFYKILVFIVRRCLDIFSLI